MKPIDLSKRKFWFLTPVRPTNKRLNGYVVWECKCDCGGTTEASTHQLLNGLKKTCGCVSKLHSKTLQENGDLVCNAPVTIRDGEPVWKVYCRCCGSVVEMTSSEFNSKTHCDNCKGSYKRASWDLTGKRFGDLEVLSLSHKDKHRNTFWNVRCTNCGREYVVSRAALRNEKAPCFNCENPSLEDVEKDERLSKAE